MAIFLFFMRVLEVLFFIGVGGSAIVVLMTLFEDLHLLVFGWGADHTEESLQK